MPGITFDLSDELHRKAKIKAAMDGAKSLKDYLLSLVQKDTGGVSLPSKEDN